MAGEGDDSGILIALYAVPEDCDAAFWAAWEQAAAFLAQRHAEGAAVLHRALAPDAEHRYAEITALPSVEAFAEAVSDPGFAGLRMPFTAHRGIYDVEREDPAAPGAAPGVVLVNPFEVPDPMADDAFLAGWERAREFLRARPGYGGTRLHRSRADDAPYRFVNIAPWADAGAFRDAVSDPEFPGRDLPFASHPALYEVVAG